MDAAELGAWRRAGFTDHPEPAGRTLLRVETLDAYGVAADGSDYARYLAGEDAPDPARKAAWTEVLETERARGLIRRRVHILETPLRHPYLRYECEWGYEPNVAAGEDIRILDLSEVHLTVEERDLLAAVGDFWVLNGQDVVRMDYDRDGGFVGAEHVTAGADIFRQAAAVAWGYAEHFTTWWARHAEEHRAHWAA